MTTITLATLLVRLKAETREYNKGVDDAQRKTKGLGDFIKKTLPLSAGAAAALAAREIKKFADESLAEVQAFEHGMREVFTLTPDITQNAMQQMQADVIEFSKEAGRLTDETVPALYQAISAGVPSENVFDFLTVASDAAKGGVTDLSTAVDGISSVVNAYGAEVINATEASDLMFTAVRGGKTTFEELSSRLFQVIPTASALGVEFGNITAALATLTSQGTPTAQATTQLRQLLVELSKESSEAAQLFDSLAGKSFKDFVSEGGNVQQALQLMERHANRTGVNLQDLFSSVEAGNAALGLTGAAAEKFSQELNAAESASGATAAAADTMSESMQNLENRVNATSEAMKLQAGEALMPLKRNWLEFRVVMNETLEANFATQNQLTDTKGALADLGIEGRKARVIMRELADATHGYNGMTADAETIAKRTEIAIELLSRGFEGNARELRAAVDEYERATQVNESFNSSLDAHEAALRAEADARSMSAEEISAWSLEAAQAAGANENLSDKLRQQSGHLDDVAAARLRVRIAQEEQKEAQEAATIAIEQERQRLEELRAAQEAAREAARQHAAMVGGFFVDALNTGSESAVSLEMQLFQAGQAAELDAKSLSILAAATGEFTEEEIEAALQAAIMTERIKQMAEAVAAGDMTAQEAVESLRQLQDAEITAGQRAEGLATSMDVARGALDEAKSAALRAKGAIESIPTSRTFTLKVKQEGSATFNLPGGDVAVAMQHGGFTGGMENKIAGFVHGQEFVFSAPAVRALGLGFLESLHALGQGGGNTLTINTNVDARGSDRALDTARTIVDQQLTAFRRFGVHDLG